MKNITYKLYQKDNNAYSDIYSILEETDNDFIPSLTSKFKIEDVTKKYIELAHTYIAYVENKPAGLVAYYPNKKPKDSYLSIITVKKAYRGLQIGKTLELKCIEFCKRIDSKGLLVNMRKSNGGLFKSRINLGYQTTKEYKLEYSDELITDLYLKF